MGLFVTDIVGESYKFWRQGDDVAITCPTGAGKTYFILNTLRCEVDYGGKEQKPILYLYNRMILGRQLKRTLQANNEAEEIPVEELDIISDIGVFSLMSYQKLAKLLENGKQVRTSDYSFVVLDEIHFLLSDSLFNHGVLNVLDWLGKCNESIRIWISATSSELWEFMKEYFRLEIQDDCIKMLEYTDKCLNGGTPILKTNDYLNVYYRYDNAALPSCRGRNVRLWSYSMPADYSYIESIRSFNSLKELAELILSTSKYEKKLVFVSTVKSAETLEKLLVGKSVLRLNAERVRTEPELIEKIVADGCYDQEICITTKILDNGTDLKDPSIRHVFLYDIVDETDFIQMLGRRRKMDDSIILYLQNIESEELIQRYERSTLQLNVANSNTDEIMTMLLHGDYKAKRMVQRFWIWDGEQRTFHKNQIAAWKAKYENVFLKKLTSSTSTGIIDVQKRWLNLDTDVEYPIAICTDGEKEDLIIYLKSIIGNPMDKDEQDAFRIKMGKSQLFQRHKSFRMDRVCGLKLINAIFESEQLRFKVESYSENRRTIWRVIEYGC